MLSQTIVVLRVDQLNRSAILGRSFVHEAIGNLEMAIEDMVALITVDPHDSVESKARLERLLCRYAERCSKEVRSVKRNSFESKWAVEKFLRCFRSEWAVLAKAEAGSPLGLVLQKIQTCDYELALDHLKQVAVESPSAVMYNLIGTLHLLAGNMRDSQAALLKSLELFPANAPVLVKCALVSMELGKYSEMTEYIEEGLTVDSQDPAIYYFRGEILAMCDNFEAAIDDFARAIQLDNAFIYAHVSHARANLALGRIQAAQDLLKEPMNAFSEDPELLHVFGETLVLQGNIKEGLSTWLQVLDLAPDFPDIHLNLAVLNHTINGCESAYEAALLAIVEKFPHFGAGHIQLAQHYLVKGKLEKATHHFDTAISRARSLQESITMCSLKAISVAKAQVAARIPECHPGLRYVELYCRFVYNFVAFFALPGPSTLILQVSARKCLFTASNKQFTVHRQLFLVRVVLRQRLRVRITELLEQWTSKVEAQRP